METRSKMQKVWREDYDTYIINLNKIIAAANKKHEEEQKLSKDT